MITVLAAPGSIAVGQTVVLEPPEAQHLRVRRAADGDIVRLVDGAGAVGTGVLRVDRRDARVEIGEAVHAPGLPPLSLVVAVGDRDRFGWLVEKATELGVTRIVPVETERTAGVGTRLRGEHLEKLRRRALESIKQCGSAWVAAIEPVTVLADATAACPAGTRWVADAGGGPPSLPAVASPVAIVVGPEGGLSDNERLAVSRAGFVPVRFGPHVLRFETAAIAAAAVVQTMRGGW